MEYTQYYSIGSQAGRCSQHRYVLAFHSDKKERHRRIHVQECQKMVVLRVPETLASRSFQAFPYDEISWNRLRLRTYMSSPFLYISPLESAPGRTGACNYFPKPPDFL